jgi:hypothetical protein
MRRCGPSILKHASPFVKKPPNYRGLPEDANPPHGRRSPLYSGLRGRFPPSRAGFRVVRGVFRRLEAISGRFSSRLRAKRGAFADGNRPDETPPGKSKEFFKKIEKFVALFPNPVL